MFRLNRRIEERIWGGKEEKGAEKELLSYSIEGVPDRILYLTAVFLNVISNLME